MPKLPILPVSALTDDSGITTPIWLNWFNAVYKNSLSIPGTYNVLYYGAQGDGVTDDSRAINSAIAAATVNGIGAVYFPNTTGGGYALGSPIILPDNVLLIGDNKKGLKLSRIKPIPGYTGHLIESIGWNATAALATRIQQSGIVGLFIDGSGTTLTAVDLYCQECFFADSTYQNIFTYGIRIAGNNSNLGLNNNVFDCYFSKVGSNRFYNAIFEDYFTADNKFFNNYIEGCANACIETRGANCQIMQNHFFDTKYHILSRDTVERQFLNNYLEFASDASILVVNGSSSENQLFMIVTGNIFRNINTGSTATGVIELTGTNCNYALIQANALRRDNGTGYSTSYFVYKSAAPTNVVLDTTNIIYVSACITTALIN